jgi:hypothetical protein
MKKRAMALLAVAAAVFGFSNVASAGYGSSSATTPDPPLPGRPYSVTYINCTVGDLITFVQAQSTPSTVTAVCAPVGATLTGSVAGQPLPAEGALGNATGSFSAAPTAPGTYTGNESGPLSAQVTFQFTIPGQIATPTTPVATTVPATVPIAGLPATGGPGGRGTITDIAFGLFVVGLGLFIVAQVRRRQQPSSA